MGTTTCEGCKQVRKDKYTSYSRCEMHRKLYHRDWRRNNIEATRESHRKNYAKLKLQTMQAYGGEVPKCSCCGEANLFFLTIDHINGNGKEHRRTLKNINVYAWLRQNKYPEGFQVLCFNCNCGKSINKNICPHKNSTLKTN